LPNRRTVIALLTRGLTTFVAALGSPLGRAAASAADAPEATSVDAAGVGTARGGPPVRLQLAHLNWSIAGNSRRKACDKFLLDVFGAQTGAEILMTPDNVGTGIAREESLLVIGDTMLVPIAAYRGGSEGDDPAVTALLERHAVDGQWIGIALFPDDLQAVARWCRDLGFEPIYRPGLEHVYFVLDRDKTLGMRFEFVKALPNDPRFAPDWDAGWWKDAHPLGIERLQTIGLGVTDLKQARDLLTGKFGFPEVATRKRPDEPADCVDFHVGGVLVEAMQPTDSSSALAAHVRDVGGIYGITFKVKSLSAAAAHLRGQGLRLIGDTKTRFLIDPQQAFTRRIYFEERVLDGDPRGDRSAMRWGS